MRKTTKTLIHGLRNIHRQRARQIGTTFPPRKPLAGELRRLRYGVGHDAARRAVKAEARYT